MRRSLESSADVVQARTLASMTIAARSARILGTREPAAAWSVGGGKCPLLVLRQRTGAGEVVVGRPEPGRRQAQKRQAQRCGIGDVTGRKIIAQEPDQLRRDDEVPDVGHEQGAGAELPAQ